MGTYRKELKTAQQEAMTKADVGLTNVDNTSDADKPVSTATQAALDLKMAKSANLSDVANQETSLGNILNLGSGSGAQGSDGVFAIDFASIRKYTLTLNANVTTLTFNNVPSSAEYIPLKLRIVQNASTGYSISTIANLDNPDDVFPDYSTVANEKSEWLIYYTATGVRVIGQANVD